mmetsp:Transcript_35803/g.52585  ORF Transcript_35803/g.52585 Transcript_35803/m.52585 type:complete len:189 (+) Transcript_35803:2-568(+)
MKLSTSATLITGLSYWTILPVSANIYLRNPLSKPCAARTCDDNSDCCPGGWTCNLEKMCEFPHPQPPQPQPQCISGGIGCDQDSSNVSLQCCPGWQCVEHPTGQFLGYCTPASSSSNSNTNRSVNPPPTPRPAARNPNNCLVPQQYNQECQYWGTLTICCSGESSWYNCLGSCSSSSNDGNDVATIDE